MPFPWLLWARYSAFLPLYPLGTASELTMVWLALSTLKRERPWSIAMPNAFNFGFDYFWTCMLIVVAYVPGACSAIICLYDPYATRSTVSLR